MVYPIDLKNALSEFDGDKLFLFELLNILIKNAKDQVKIIKEAITKKETEKIWKEAHSIKGGAANLRANSLARIAHELEKAGKANNLSDCQEKIEQLDNEIIRLEEYIKKSNEFTEMMK